MKRGQKRARAREAEKNPIRGNLLDRAINFFNPVAGARRFKARAFQAISGSYIGANKSRRQTSLWNRPLGDADNDSLMDIPTLRDSSRDLIRNDPLAVGAINTVLTNVVGTGLTLKPNINADVLGLSVDQADELERQIQREWALWSEAITCDSTKTQIFTDIQELVFRSALESGDVIVLQPFIKRDFMPYKLAVQVVEADRLSNPTGEPQSNKITAGVEKDSNGAPVAYWIANHHPGSSLGPVPNRKHERKEAFGKRSGRRNVIHLFTKLRPGQTRGIPFLAPVIEPLKMLGKYTEAEVTAAVISGMFTVFVKTESAQGLDLSSDLGEETGAEASDKDLKLASGAVVDLAPDESIETANPGRPNTAFDPFVEAILRQIGAALEIPFEILIKHFTASYSASRAALLEAWRFFRKRRKWLANNFCQPVYENWFDEAVIIGRINAPGYFSDPIIRKAYLKAEWNGPGRGMIKEKEEIEAAQKRVDGGFSTLEREIAELHGGDFGSINRQLVKEKQLRVKGGLEEPVAGPKLPAQDPPAVPDLDDQEDDR